MMDIIMPIRILRLFKFLFVIVAIGFYYNNCVKIVPVACERAM
jgi:hypothetical protein